MNEPIANAIAALDLTESALAAATDDEYLVELVRLVDMVHQNALLQRCLREIELELADALHPIAEMHGNLAQQLRVIRDRLAPASSAVNDPDEVRAGESTRRVLDDDSLEFFDHLAAGKPDPRVPLSSDPGVDPSVTRKMLDILLRHLGTESKADVGHEHEPIPAELIAARDDLDRLNKERIHIRRSHAGVIWIEVCDAVARLDPRKDYRGILKDMARLIDAVFVDNALRRMYFGIGSRYASIAPDPTHREVVRDMRIRQQPALRRLFAELKLRLRTRANSQWAIRRYIAEAMCFRRTDILSRISRFRREAAAIGKRRSLEKYLVDDAACFLFRLGFNVLTERIVGSGRLDVYEEVLGVGVSRDALLIEAKIYDSQASAKKAVIDGLAQLHDYAARMEAGFRTTENYLLLYRLSGPKLVLPKEGITVGDYLHQFAYVDIATSAESGSRTKRLLELTAEQLREAVKARAADPAPPRSRRSRNQSE